MNLFKIRHAMAKFILIPFLFILFLSVHFTAWGGVYTEDGLSLECIVEQGRHIIEEGDSRLTLSTIHFEPQIQNLWLAAFNMIGLFCPFFFALFFWRANLIIAYTPDTPVSLFVRLNN